MRIIHKFLSPLFTQISYLAALDNQPPLIKSTDYDARIFDPTLLEPNESGSSASTPGLSLFADLVCVQGEVLERLRGSMPCNETEAIMRVLDLEDRLDRLRSRLVRKTSGSSLSSNISVLDDRRCRADIAGRLLRQIHFNW